MESYRGSGRGLVWWSVLGGKGVAFGRGGVGEVESGLTVEKGGSPGTSPLASNRPAEGGRRS